MQISQKAERVVEWRKSLTTMDNETFLSVIRMYVGEVKTPYNKQDLIERLSSFFRREENKASVVRLLSKDDARLIAAIRFLPKTTMDKIKSFLSSVFPEHRVEILIANLMQRMVLFEQRPDKKDEGETVYLVNPLLEDALYSVVTLETLLPPPRIAAECESDAAPVTLQTLAAFTSYIFSRQDICKIDGSLKKKSAGELSKILGAIDTAEYLLDAFKNLSLFQSADKGFAPDWKRLEYLAAMDSTAIFSYICVGAAGRYTNRVFYTDAQLLVDTLKLVGSEPYTLENLARLMLLVFEQEEDGYYTKGGKFQRLLERVSNDFDFSEIARSKNTEIERILDACVAFGVLRQCAVDENKKRVYRVAPFFFDSVKPSEEEKKNAITIDAGGTVTVLPCLTMADYLALIQFLDILKCDTASVFEINKKTAMRAFDLGLTPEDIKEVLCRYMNFKVPQNIEMEISDWYASYSSATLYKGYVLKVSSEMETRIKNNKSVAAFIKEQIAPGVYLMNFKSDEEAERAIAHSGLDFIGKIHDNKESGNSIPLYSPDLRRIPEFAEMCDQPAQKTSYAIGTDEEQGQFIDSLVEKAKAIPMTENQMEGIVARIKAKLIINEEQLRPEIVRFEQMEAGAMDFQGKMHVVESAFHDKSAIEVEIDNLNLMGVGTIVFQGLPVAMYRENGDIRFSVLIGDNKKVMVYASKALRIKKMPNIYLEHSL